MLLAEHPRLYRDNLVICFCETYPISAQEPLLSISEALVRPMQPKQAQPRALFLTSGLFSATLNIEDKYSPNKDSVRRERKTMDIRFPGRAGGIEKRRPGKGQSGVKEIPQRTRRSEGKETVKIPTIFANSAVKKMMFSFSGEVSRHGRETIL